MAFFLTILIHLLTLSRNCEFISPLFLTIQVHLVTCDFFIAVLTSSRNLVHRFYFILWHFYRKSYFIWQLFLMILIHLATFLIVWLFLANLSFSRNICLAFLTISWLFFILQLFFSKFWLQLIHIFLQFWHILWYFSHNSQFISQHVLTDKALDALDWM